MTTDLHPAGLSPADVRSAVRSAELALINHLCHQLRLDWPVASYSGVDRESGKPLITVYATDWAAGNAWVEEMGGRWQGYRVLVVERGRG